jgi:phosphotransferase system enzyme I (PtsI)
MHPAQLLEVKQRVLGSNLADTEAQVKRMLRTEEPERLREQLASLNA